MKVGAIIKSARQRMGLTQGELAAKVSMSTSTVCELENDKRANPPAPAEMVAISDSVMDRTMLKEYCDTCPIRDRILIRKFPPLNNIVPGALPATVKVIEKISVAADRLQPMLTKICNRNFAAEPDFADFRNETIIRLLDLKRGTEILLEQFQEQGLVSADELKLLMFMQQKQCEVKGHHEPEKSK